MFPLSSWQKNRSITASKIKIVHAAWIRDHTWPVGLEAPEPDDVAPPGDDTVSDLQLNSLQFEGSSIGSASGAR